MVKPFVTIRHRKTNELGNRLEKSIKTFTTLDHVGCSPSSRGCVIYGMWFWIPASVSARFHQNPTFVKTIFKKNIGLTLITGSFQNIQTSLCDAFYFSIIYITFVVFDLNRVHIFTLNIHYYNLFAEHISYDLFLVFQKNFLFDLFYLYVCNCMFDRTP